VINLNAGYVLDLQKKFFTKWRNKLTNQFSSIIEDKASADIITIYGFPIGGIPLLQQPSIFRANHAGLKLFIKTITRPFITGDSCFFPEKFE
jgi:hypothetical protein